MKHKTPAMTGKALGLACAAVLACTTGLGAGFLLTAGEAAAQPAPGERVYVDLGAWTIYSRDRSRTCTLRHRSRNVGSLVMTKTGSDASTLSLDLVRPNVFVGDAVFVFDETEFPARLRGDRSYSPLADFTAVEDAFRQSRTLSLVQGGATLATIPLNASSAGFRLLKQCAEQGRLGMARPVESSPTPAPSPAPSTSAPALPATQVSQARTPVPINLSSWVREDDPIRMPRRGGGVLRFTLVVSPLGSAQECVVNGSTGSRNLDAQLCELLLRRARFEPALNDAGDAVQGRFSSSLRYDVER